MVVYRHADGKIDTVRFHIRIVHRFISFAADTRGLDHTDKVEMISAVIIRT